MQNTVEYLHRICCEIYALIFVKENFYITIWKSRYDKKKIM